MFRTDHRCPGASIPSISFNWIFRFEIDKSYVCLHEVDHMPQHRWGASVFAFGVTASMMAMSVVGNVCVWYGTSSTCPSSGAIVLSGFSQRINGRVTSAWFQGLDVASITKVDLSNNQITEVAGQAFDALIALTTLTLSNNWIMSIPSGPFATIPTLTTLSLNGNSIPAITNLTFSGVPSLTCLELTWNQLTVVSANMFASLPQLQTLMLGYNSMTELPSDLFKATPYLSYVSFFQGKLLTVPAHVFDVLTSLAYLDLSNNYVAMMPRDLFRYNKLLTTVKLTMNPGVGRCVPTPPMMLSSPYPPLPYCPMPSTTHRIHPGTSVKPLTPKTSRRQVAGLAPRRTTIPPVSSKPQAAGSPLPASKHPSTYKVSSQHTGMSLVRRMATSQPTGSPDAKNALQTFTSKPAPALKIASSTHSLGEALYLSPNTSPPSYPTTSTYPLFTATTMAIMLSIVGVLVAIIIVIVVCTRDRSTPIPGGTRVIPNSVHVSNSSPPSPSQMEAASDPHPLYVFVPYAVEAQPSPGGATGSKHLPKGRRLQASRGDVHQSDVSELSNTDWNNWD